MSINFTAEQRHAISDAVDPKKITMPTAIAGPAGSGKTLVALEIARQLANQQTLGLSGKDDAPTYFVTYTHELKDFAIRQINNDPELRSAKIIVKTVHAYLGAFLETNGKKFQYNDGAIHNIKNRKKFLRDYIKDNRDSLELTGLLNNPDFLSEEIGWMLGRGIRNKADYLAAERTGRRVRLLESQRQKVYDALARYMEHIQNSPGKDTVIDYDDIGNYVLYQCKHVNTARRVKRMARNLIVDEVQDLPKSWTEALRLTVSGKIVYAGDTSQAIYPRGFVWREVVGQSIRPIHLTEDFRNTKQIYRLARSLMDFDTGIEDETGDPNRTRRDGPKPSLIFCKNKDAQYARITKTVDRIIANDQKSSIAIAFPRRDGRYKDLRSLFEKRSNIVVTTMHSLKGLEADHVILANVDNDQLSFNNEFTEENIDRHLLYVGITRAKKTLTILTASDTPAWTLSELNFDLLSIDISENPRAYDNLCMIRGERKQRVREDFEDAVHETVMHEEAVEIAQDNLESEKSKYGSESEPAKPLETEQQKDRIIEELTRQRDEAIKKFEKSEENLLRLENELRLYRAREESSKSAVSGRDAVDARKYQFRDDAKILILGASGVKAKDFGGIFKRVGLEKDDFEYLDYDAVASGEFNALNLLSTVSYSDIFVSQTPHKAKGMGGYSSLVEFLRENANELPKLTVFENEDHTLKKFTNTDLKEALQKSDLFAFRHQL